MAFYPFYKELRDASLKMSTTGNFGLWYNKFVPPAMYSRQPTSGNDTAPVKYYLEKYEQMKNGAADLLRRKIDDQEAYCTGFPTDGYEEITVCAELKAPLITGSGETHPHEVSMVFDHNMGIPYIPASGVKGIVRFAHTLSLIPEAERNGELGVGGFDDEAAWTNVPLMFGTQKSRGRVVFLDAYPAEVPDLHRDIMDPHYGPYYMEGKPPADHHNPTPIEFLTVKPGTTFIFWAIAEKKDDLPQKVRAAFRRALTEEGVGAKTAVGYGRFKINDNHLVAILERRRKRQAEAENQLCPWRAHIGKINAVTDWGQFQQNILDHEVLTNFRNEREVADAVAAKASEIRNKWRNKWEAERDYRIRDWLKPAGVVWQMLAEVEDPSTEEKSEECGRIEALRDWGAFKSCNIEPGKLPLDALRVLKKKMEVWGCNDKNVKSDKKAAYKKVKDLLRQQ